MYLHNNIIINSEKQKSAQGSVFYVKLANDDSRELVLKIYKSDDMKSYIKELSVFKKLDEMYNRHLDDSENLTEKVVGFPKMISNLENNS